MRILIYGGNGWIGSLIREYIDKELAPKGVSYFLGKERANNYTQIRKEVYHYLQKENITHVLCLIGRTSGPENNTIDYLEIGNKHEKLVMNIRDNLFGPLVLADICKEFGLHLTYMGTGCIFSYEENQNQNIFNEEDKPNFFGSNYSIVKGFTDQLMHLNGYNKHVLNVRIRMPIVGYHCPKNFITKITKYEYICSIPNSMTVLDDMIPIMLDCMYKSVKGTINLVNKGTISHNEILELYKEYVDRDFKWKNISEEELNKLLKGERSNNELSIDTLEKMYPKCDFDIRASLINLFKKWK